MTRAALFLIFLRAAPAQQPGATSLHPAVDPSHRLTTSGFFRDAARNFGAVIDVRSIAPLAGGVAAYGIATGPEQRIEKHFSRGDMWGAWSEPGKYIGNPLVLASASGLLFAASRGTEDVKFRSFAYSLLHGSILTAGMVWPAKAGFRRLRPNTENHHAFPSGHAADSFMYATVISDHYGWRAAVPAYVIATYVAATRLEERKHHLTDIVAGATFGYLAGKTVSRRVRKGAGRFGLQVYPSRYGFAGALHIQLP